MLFVFVLSTQTAYPSYNATAQTSAQGGGQPVSASTSGMVDPYTGDFHYSVPLLTVPGPNGESVDVSASYHAGIRVDEKASWLGLGWDYNPGEISRQVVGAPDDVKGYTFFSKSQTGHSAIAYYGALYSSSINQTPSFLSPTNGSFNPYSGSNLYNPNKQKSMDISSVDKSLSPADRYFLAGNPSNSNAGAVTAVYSRLKKYSVPYRSMAYDNYAISSPGLSGNLKPYYFGAMVLNENLAYNGTVSYSSTFDKKAQFYFENSVQKTIVNQSSTELNSDNRVKSGVFVKYYTNTEINDNSKLFDNSTQKGFLDYKVVSSGSRRNLSSVDADGVGAFEVTDMNGMTYHYSLAVYSFEETEKTEDASGTLYYTYKPLKYANSWKLTAVTGPDFQDANNNHMADIGDTGYWIAYNYSQWSSAYMWTSNEYDLKDDLYTPTFNWFTTNSNYTPKSYARKRSMVTGKTELYYLNNIQTATHTALFVKSVRQDEKSHDPFLSGGNPVPMLKLDAIVLLRNEDLGTLYNSANAISGSDLDSRFSYATCSAAQADPYFMNITKYNLFKNSLKPKSLKSVAFSQDYSLCKKYYYNINNHFTTTNHALSETAASNPMANLSVMIGYASFDKNYSSHYSSDNSAASGKLTLNHIVFQDLMGDKITPSMDFDYAQTDSNKNPDYDPDKTDLWGYYKSDGQAGYSHYTTNTSKDYTSAWSLRTITTPLNGQVQVEYESDDYVAEGFADDAWFMPDPTQPFIGASGTEPYIIFPISHLEQNPLDNSFDNYLFTYGDYPTSIPYYHTGAMVIPTAQQCAAYQMLNGPQVPFITVNEVSAPYLGYSGGYWHNSATPNNDYEISGCSTTVLVNPMGVAYVILKATKMYGGGIRVKTIKTIEPSTNDTYTESYTYESGYCPEVPKKLSMEAYQAPTYYSLMLNSKMAIEGLSSNVGYSTVTIKSISQNNTDNGSTVLSFYNEPVNNPIRIMLSAGTHPTGREIVKSNPTGYCDPGSLPSCPSGSPSNIAQQKADDYIYTVQLRYDNGKLMCLGRLENKSILPAGSTTPVMSTSYTYDDEIQESTYLKEDYDYIRLEDIEYISYHWYDCGTTKYFSGCDVRDIYHVYSDYINHDYFLASTTTTRDGITTIEEVMDRDANTGQPVRTKTVDPTRGIFITKTSPAYSNTTYAALGLKSVNESYKNQPLLVENAKTFRLPITSDLTIDEVSDPHSAIMVSEAKNTYTVNYPYRTYNASTSKYENSSQTQNWWRLDKTYTRLLDDVTDYSNTTYNWRQLSEGTLYDTDNNKIEETGLNSRKAASKWGYSNRYKLAAIANANYNSFAFSSFEDKTQVASGVYHFGGEVNGGVFQVASASQVQTPGGSVYPSVSLVNPHTGSYMAKVPAHTDGPAFNARNFETGRSYIANVWVHSSSPSDARLVMELDGYIDPGGGGSSYAISNHTYIAKNDSKNITVGSWTLMSLEVIVPEKFDLTATHLLKVYVENNSSSGDAYFDDLAFHPKDAAMAGNVYEARTGLLKAQLDNDNFATLYNYDNAGRVISTYKEYSGGVKKITENQYHFSKP